VVPRYPRLNKLDRAKSDRHHGHPKCHAGSLRIKPSAAIAANASEIKTL
jgi:hypothetical protein